MKILKSPWFKCIACLLAIAVISGALISTLSGLWKVTPEMRTARAITKIYGEEKMYFTILDVDALLDGGEELTQKPIEYDFGKINKIYEVGSDLLFQATGYKGYKNGTITLWIKAVKSGETYSIDKVLLETFEKQTLMGKLTDDFYGRFKLTDVTESYSSGQYFNTGVNPVSGATYSATAACNAVNCVIKYFGENGGNA